MSKVQAILCDDVRVEDNGKFIAIGIYSEMVGIRSFPYHGVFSLLLIVSDTPSGTRNMTLVIKLKSQPMLSDLNSFQFNVGENGRSTLSFRGIPIEAEETNQIEIYCAVDDEDLRLVETIPIDTNIRVEEVSPV